MISYLSPLKVVMTVHEAVSELSTVFAVWVMCRKRIAESIGNDISHRLKETNPAPFV
ncbi:MAG: hypothetical protein JRG74_06520 [Deltaproteobacteria bacterium]|nr:hypothetical protein [Deltaproteobacteria bacterium]